MSGSSRGQVQKSNTKSHHKYQSNDFDEAPIVDDEESKILNKFSSKTLKTAKKRVQSATGVRDKVTTDDRA